MPDITISPALKSDAAEITALDRAAWLDLRHADSIPDGLHAWSIWCEHALTFIARDGSQQLVGVVLAFSCGDKSYCLHKVMVTEGERGRGVGSRLFSRLVGELDRRGASCFLTVSPENTRAIELYRKWGFDLEELVAGYFRKGEDRLVLTRLPLELEIDEEEANEESGA